MSAPPIRIIVPLSTQFISHRRFSSFTFQLTGLGAIWTLTDIIHMGEEDEEQKVPAALSKLDT